MPEIIIGLPHIENAKTLRKALVKNGYEVTAICDTGRQLINIANDLDGGIIICAYQFSDMLYKDLLSSLPKGFFLILAASPEKLEYCSEDELTKVSLPLHLSELTGAIHEIEKKLIRKKKKEKSKPKFRSLEEQKLIDDAKRLLMKKKNLSENEAHRYLQKLSMDSGNSFVEAAGMYLDIHGKDWLE